MRRLLGALRCAAIVSAAFLFAVDVMAQDLCDDPAAVCGATIEQRCLARVGAGSLAVEDDDDGCRAQFSAYSACLAEAAQCPSATRGQTTGAQSDRCAPFVEQTLFEAAQSDPRRRDDFLRACPDSPLGSLLKPIGAPSPPASAEKAPSADEGPPSDAATLRSGETVLVCVDQERAPVEIALRIWKRNATTPDTRATLVAPERALETTVRVGQRVDLAPGCAIELLSTSYRGRFFAEIAIYNTQ